MKRSHRFGKVASAAAVSALALASLSWQASPALRALPETAQRFAWSWRAVSESSDELSLWDRITYTLILAEGPRNLKRAGHWPALPNSGSQS